MLLFGILSIEWHISGTIVWMSASFASTESSSNDLRDVRSLAMDTEIAL